MPVRHARRDSFMAAPSGIPRCAPARATRRFRRRRRSADRRAENTVTDEGSTDNLDTGVVIEPRRKKQRRRHIDPTTCERDYSNPEIEFMRAMDDYKRDAGRMFPTCSEVLEVIRALGYYQLTEEQADILDRKSVV